MPLFESLIFSDRFPAAFADRRFTVADRAALLKALELLNQNETHPSLRVHALKGAQAGTVSAWASRSLRINFTRAADGKKPLIDCTKHYDD